MRILVLGGDGFCGWPTALHLSNLGHDVTIVDNLSRRHIDIELEAESLTPIRPIHERIRAWKDVSGRDIDLHTFTIGEHYHRLLSLIEEQKPDSIVHFAEQRAAPYSMKSSAHKRYTVNNNLNATNDAARPSSSPASTSASSSISAQWASTATNTAGCKSRRSYLPIRVETPDGDLIDQEILYPANPGSILSHDEDAGSAVLPLHQQERQAKDHRPPSGHRLGGRKRRRPSWTNGSSTVSTTTETMERSSAQFLAQAAVSYPSDGAGPADSDRRAPSFTSRTPSGASSWRSRTHRRRGSASTSSIR